MKLLVLLLLLAVSLQAQTIADAARKERARQARIRSAQVITGKGTSESITTPRPAPAAPATAAPAPTAPVPATPPKPAVAPVPPPAPAVVEDPAVKWQAETARLRKKIQDLEDQERTLQLQVTQLTNQFFAPVSDQTSRDQAQAQLGETQSKLTAVRADLDQTKKTLDALQLQGPPAKK